MSTVHADFQIAFGAGSGDQAHLSATIDSRADGYNQGRTSFRPGDVVYFLVHKSANVTYDHPVASAGGITSHGSTTVLQTDDLAFPNVRTATLSLPTSGIQSSQWLGNALGALSLVDEMTVQADVQGVAVARVTSAAPADVWSLSSPASINGLTDYSIIIFIQGHVTGVAE